MRSPSINFSVIIPTYNGGEIVKRAIASVQSQTYSDYEIIIIDDGSTDDTWNLLQKLAKEDPKIVIAKIPNSGHPAKPRNHGIVLAKGDYVCFLDQDDTWRPTKLKEQVLKLKTGDFDVVYSDALVHDDRSGEVFLYSSHMRTMPEGQVTSALIVENFLPMLTTSIRRQRLDKIGQLNESLPGVDDYDLWLRLALTGVTFGYIDKPLADYYLSESNLSHHEELMVSSLLRCYDDLAKAFPNHYAELHQRAMATRSDLFGYYLTQLDRRTGSRNARIRTAVRAYWTSRGFYQKLRLVKRLVRTIV